MRRELATYMEQHPDLWQDYFQPDRAATRSVERGRRPLTYMEWAAAIRRPGWWVDGLTLEGVSALIRSRLVIFEETGDVSPIPS